MIKIKMKLHQSKKSMSRNEYFRVSFILSFTFQTVTRDFTKHEIKNPNHALHVHIFCNDIAILIELITRKC
jgi:hypothetical protein